MNIKSGNIFVLNVEVLEFVFIKSVDMIVSNVVMEVVYVFIKSVVTIVLNVLVHKYVNIKSRNLIAACVIKIDINAFMEN